ncbi:hypothetical protein SAY86_027933 [Trapa natans]|uniref:Uncharacterized protein n=1 Tax=Trapa natans TaxID=22666 RepID=A0AAN7MBZ8_TRANT|nr:hypothetical protein SAY86_027933 [Trapa natans]
MNLKSTTHGHHQESLLFSSSTACPLFMFETASFLEGYIASTGNYAENDPNNLCSGLWTDMSQYSGQSLTAQSRFTSGTVDVNYNLPPLIENVESSGVPAGVQSCGMDLQRQDLSEWVEVESQQCSNFLFWDNMEGQAVLGGEDAAAQASSNENEGVDDHLSSFPSTFTVK